MDELQKKHIAVVPAYVKVAHASRNLLPSCTHGILMSLIEAVRGGDASFFTYTCYDEELCFTFPEKDIKLFELPGVTITSASWVPLFLCEGALGFDSSGIVERMTKPLAQASIPVFYLSTYLTDYVLVEKNHLQQAFDCLSNLYIIDVESSEVLQSIAPDVNAQLLLPSVVQEKIPGSPHLSKAVKLSASPLCSDPNVPIMVTPKSKPVYLCSLPFHVLQSNFLLLMELIFKKLDSHFFTVSMTPDEASFIVDEEMMSELTLLPDISFYNEKWFLISFSVGENSTEECGIIWNLSRPFQDISIFHVSAVRHNHILVKEGDRDRCKRVLETQENFHVL
mmetsp:Transcript_53357/g.133955  ORF Transcript_53357/g.133955 Transcript_53357/m.133955 type:complete len:337 (-) Transcript_53357:162-1172(-)